MLSGLVLVGQLSTLFHLALVRHVTCPQHGELVHATDDAAAISGARAGLQIRAVPPSVDHHGHDHCLISTSRREDSVGPAAARVFVPAAAAVSAVSRQDPAQSSRGVALLRLAPKSSPPV